jgi:putative MATE family efflux protein
MAISGLALTLPLMNMAVAFGALVGAGAASMVSIRLGEQNRKDASLILANAVILNLVISLIFSLVMLLFLNRILYVFGASKFTIVYAREFMQIILAANVLTHVYIGLNNIMRASGYPRKAMITTLLTVGVNIILAPLFIFVFRWGIRGAAIATVCAQFAGLVWVVSHFLRRDSTIHFVSRYFTLKAYIIRDIFSIGMSTCLLNLCACLITIIMNLRLARYGGDFAIGAFGIINSLLSFFAMIIIGVTQGMQPIAGFNFGAGKMERVRMVFRYAIIAGTGITFSGFLLGEIFPRQIAELFTTDRQLIAITADGMKTIVMMFPLVGFQMVTVQFFQSIGKATISIFLSLTRQVLFLIPAILILSHFMGLKGVWMGNPTSDLASCIVTFMVLRKQSVLLKQK